MIELEVVSQGKLNLVLNHLFSEKMKPLSPTESLNGMMD